MGRRIVQKPRIGSLGGAEARRDHVGQGGRRTVPGVPKQPASGLYTRSRTAEQAPPSPSGSTPSASPRLRVNHNEANGSVREVAGLCGRVQNVHLYCLSLQWRIAPAPLNTRCGAERLPFCKQEEMKMRIFESAAVGL